MIAPMTDPVPRRAEIPSRADVRSGGSSSRAEIVVDLAAIRHNVRILKDLVSVDAPVQLMTVVKADGYGHGMVEAAAAARDGGADWLGVATIEEALALRAAGDRGPLLCWLSAPGDDFAAAVAAGVEVTAYSVAELDEIAAAGPARVQLKVDTGLSRGGAARADWEELFAAAAAHEDAGRVRVTGIWSHFAASDEPAHPANDQQETAFRDGAGPRREGRARPRGHPPRQLGGRDPATVLPLRPGALRDRVLRARPRARHQPPPGVAAGDDRPRATGDEQARRRGRGRVLRPHVGDADADTTVGLVPAGYGEGIPRAAGNTASVWVDDSLRPIRGRVCMDQLVIELHGELPPAGTEVILFGPGDLGEPTAQDWAEAVGTISYEIVTRIGGRLVRRHVDSEETTDDEGTTR